MTNSMDRNTALLLLDLQNDIVDPKGKLGQHGLAKAAAERGVLKNSAKILSAFRARNLPVVFVRVGFRRDYADALSVAPRVAKMKESGAVQIGTWGTEIHPEVAPQPGELIITKQCVNPFFSTQLHAWLCRHQIRNLVLGGVATNLVVEATTRYADDAGFAVTVLEDCCAGPSPELHAFAVEKILPMFGKVEMTDAYLARMS